MFNEKNGSMEEVEKIVKDGIQREHDLALGHYATISGIRGEQFGREIFSTVLPFKDLVGFLEVFPEVQRNIIKRKVGKIKNYVLGGLEDNSAMRFFSAITVTARGHIFYDHNTQKVAIDTNNSKLSVNDGQHRFYGISEAINELEAKANRSNSEEYRSIMDKVNSLKNMIIPVVIFNQITEKEEAQLFHDLNNLAQRPARSATIKLAQTDLFSRLAREIAVENKWLKKYGVEMDKSSIQKSNPNTVLLTTIYNCIKLLFWKEYKQNYNFLNEDNYKQYKNRVNQIFNNVFEALPHDLYIKEKYLIEKSYTLKGICKFIHHCITDIQIDEKLIYETIHRVDWTLNFTKWSIYGATRSKRGNLVFSGGEGGVYATFDALMDTLKFKSEGNLLERLEVIEQEKENKAV